MDPAMKALELTVLKVSERMCQALQQYARTGDVRCLILPVRHLIPCHDENADK